MTVGISVDLRPFSFTSFDFKSLPGLQMRCILQFFVATSSSGISKSPNILSEARVNEIEEMGPLDSFSCQNTSLKCRSKTLTKPSSPPVMTYLSFATEMWFIAVECSLC